MRDFGESFALIAEEVVILPFKREMKTPEKIAQQACMSANNEVPEKIKIFTDFR